MGAPPESQKSWQSRFRQQAITNGQRWLRLLTTDPRPDTFLAQNYENILRALEALLADETQIDLSMALIKAISVNVMNFADWDRWRVYLLQALEQTSSPEHALLRAYLFVQIGSTHSFQGRFTEAIGCMEQAELLYDQQQQFHDYAIALNRRGLILTRIGQVSEGINLSQKGLQIAQEAQAEEAVAEINLNLSGIYSSIREWGKGLAAAQEAYTYYQQQNKTTLSHVTLNNIINALWHLEQSAEALHLADELTIDCEQTGDIQSLINLKTSIGILYFERGEYRLAENYWYEAQRLVSQTGQVRTQAVLLNNLGHLYTRLQEWDAAEEMLQQAIAIYAELGDIQSQADTLDNLAECYRLQNKMAECRACLQIAIQLLEQSDLSVNYYRELWQKLTADLHQLESDI